jgi:DNA-binding LacI/PurR family transcriptional regulator
MRRSTNGEGSGDNESVLGLADSGKPRHRHVFDTLLGEITAGRFRPGDRIPTEAELAKTFSASRTTISRAMRDLKGRGLIQRQRGGGTRVAQVAVESGGNRIAFFAPFAPLASNLGFMDGQIHAHLADLTARRGDDMRLQLIGRRGNSQLEQMLSAVEEMVDKGINGVFYYPIELPPETMHYNQLVVEKMHAAGLAVVLVDRDIVSFPQRSKLTLVTFDNRRSGYLVTDHLIKRGCKRIAFIGTPYVSSASADRTRGYIDAMEDNDLPADRSWIRRADLRDLDAAFCRQLIEEVRPDAIICKQDSYAAVVGRHLIEMGLKIGQDVMLAGFDDQPIAEVLPVPLTTVRFPVDPLTQLSYECLLALLGSPADHVPSLVLVDVELVVRPSTGPVAAQAAAAV